MWGFILPGSTSDPTFVGELIQSHLNHPHTSVSRWWSMINGSSWYLVASYSSHVKAQMLLPPCPPKDMCLQWISWNSWIVTSTARESRGKNLVWGRKLNTSPPTSIWLHITNRPHRLDFTKFLGTRKLVSFIICFILRHANGAAGSWISSHIHSCNLALMTGVCPPQRISCQLKNKLSRIQKGRISGMFVSMSKKFSRLLRDLKSRYLVCLSNLLTRSLYQELQHW